MSRENGSVAASDWRNGFLWFCRNIISATACKSMAVEVILPSPGGQKTEKCSLFSTLAAVFA